MNPKSISRSNLLLLWEKNHIHYIRNLKNGNKANGIIKPNHFSNKNTQLNYINSITDPLQLFAIIDQTFNIIEYMWFLDIETTQHITPYKEYMV
jgi:hypothetical protein